MQSDDPDAARRSPRRPRTVLILWALLCAAIVGPALILALFGAISYRDDVARSRTTLLTQVDVLHEHSLRVFDLHRVVVDRVRELVEWRRGGDRTLHEQLHTLVAELRPLSSIWVLDRDGGVIATSAAFPAPISVNLADRDYFVALRDDPDRAVFVSEIGGGASTAPCSSRSPCRFAGPTEGSPG